MWLGSLSEKWKILTAPLPRFNFITRWAIKAVLFVCGGLIRIEHRETLETCPWPVIFALNHDNYSETVLVPAVLVYLCGGKKTSFLVHWMFRVIPLINWFLKQIDPIWIYNRSVRFAWMRRRKPHRQGDIFTQALLRCKKNRSIGIFPEGSRNKNPLTLKRGRLGIGRIALETGLPVIPVGIDFPGRAGRRKIPVIGRIIMRVGEPLYFEAELQEAAKLQQDRVLSALHKHTAMFKLYTSITHRVMLEISRLCGKTYPYSQPQ